MDVKLDKNIIDSDINKKCTLCGKVFKLAKDLTRHKNRKTPCIIRELTLEDINNTYRCIFCNKISSNASNLIKHHKICKVKNDNMGVITEKVIYDQKIAKLERENIQRFAELEKQTIVLREELNQLKTKESSSVNTPNIITNYNNCIFQNVIIGSYLKPDIKHLFNPDDFNSSLFMEIYRQYGNRTPIELIQTIWFNENIPQNLAIYHTSEGTSLVHGSVGWERKINETLIREIHNKVYDITKTAMLDSQFSKSFDRQLLHNIRKNECCPYWAAVDREEIEKKMIEGRRIASTVVPRSRDKKLKDIEEIDRLLLKK